MLSKTKIRIAFLVSMILIASTLLVNTYLYLQYQYYQLTHKWTILVSIIGLMLFWAVVLMPLEKFLKIGGRPLRPKIRSVIMSVLILVCVLFSARGIQLLGIHLNKQMTITKLSGGTAQVKALVTVRNQNTGMRRKRIRTVTVAAYTVAGKQYEGIVDSSFQRRREVELTVALKDPKFFKVAE